MVSAANIGRMPHKSIPFITDSSVCHAKYTKNEFVTYSIQRMLPGGRETKIIKFDTLNSATNRKPEYYMATKRDK